MLITAGVIAALLYYVAFSWANAWLVGQVNDQTKAEGGWREFWLNTAKVLGVGSTTLAYGLAILCAITIAVQMANGPDDAVLNLTWHYMLGIGAAMALVPTVGLGCALIAYTWGTASSSDDGYIDFPDCGHGGGRLNGGNGGNFAGAGGSFGGGGATSHWTADAASAELPSVGLSSGGGFEMPDLDFGGSDDSGFGLVIMAVVLVIFIVTAASLCGYNTYFGLVDSSAGEGRRLAAIARRTRAIKPLVTERMETAVRNHQARKAKRNARDYGQRV